MARSKLVEASERGDGHRNLCLRPPLPLAGRLQYFKVLLSSESAAPYKWPGLQNAFWAGSLLKTQSQAEPCDCSGGSECQASARQRSVSPPRHPLAHTAPSPRALRAPRWPRPAPSPPRSPGTAPLLCPTPPARGQRPEGSGLRGAA